MWDGNFDMNGHEIYMKAAVKLMNTKILIKTIFLQPLLAS